MTQFARLLKGAAGAAIVCLAVAALAVPAFAETQFERDHPTAIGSFLAGQQAMVNLRTADAARFFGQAASMDEDNLTIVNHSFMAYLAAGDIDSAAGVASHLLALSPDNDVPRLVLATQDLKARRYAAATKELDGLGTDDFSSITGGILRAWALTGDHKRPEAFAELDKLASTGLGDFLVFHRALMADVSGDTTDAVALITKAYNASPDAARTVEAYARVMGDAGHFDEALAAITRFDGQGQDDPILAMVAKDLKAHQRPPMYAPDVQSGAAEMFHGVAVALASDRSQQLALGFLQLGAYLDPHDDVIPMLIGQILDNAGRHNEANAYYNDVASGSPLKLSAEIHVAQNFSALGDTPEAISKLTTLAQAHPESLAAISLLGQMLRINKQYEKAAAADTQALALTGGKDFSDWGLYYQRGIAYERSHQWDKAQADFLSALKLNPDQPDVLNYLGYSWVDRGENLDRALVMIQKAVKVRPTDGYIVDSLGWAYYKLDRTEEAVKTLEQAVQLKPNDPAINNHLGDAYWKAGRKLEAHYQWSIASTLDTDGELKADIAVKQARWLKSSEEPAVLAP